MTFGPRTTFRPGDDGVNAYRLMTAKRPETREKRLNRFLEMLENGETFH